MIRLLMKYQAHSTSSTPRKERAGLGVHRRISRSPFRVSSAAAVFKHWCPSALSSEGPRACRQAACPAFNTGAAAEERKSELPAHALASSGT